MEKRVGVLFISRRNSLRSVLAEACLAHLAGQKFRAASCGQPGHIDAAIHPAAIGALGSASIPVPKLRPRDWNELARSGAPALHFVIVLDASVAPLPGWRGQPDVALWDLPDAAALQSPEETAMAAIRLLYSLRRRLELLVNLPLATDDRAAVRSDLRDLAHMR